MSNSNKMKEVVITADELIPYFPEKTDIEKLERLAEIITVDSKNYFKKKEELEKERGQLMMP